MFIKILLVELITDLMNVADRSEHFDEWKSSFIRYDLGLCSVKPLSRRASSVILSICIVEQLKICYLQSK